METGRNREFMNGDIAGLSHIEFDVGRQGGTWDGDECGTQSVSLDRTNGCYQYVVSAFDRADLDKGVKDSLLEA